MGWWGEYKTMLEYQVKNIGRPRDSARVTYWSFPKNIIPIGERPISYENVRFNDPN